MAKKGRYSISGSLHYSLNIYPCSWSSLDYLLRRMVRDHYRKLIFRDSLPLFENITHSDVHCDSARNNEVINELLKSDEDVRAHINPPTNTQATHEISDTSCYESVDSPVVRHTHMSQVMHGKS